MPLFLHQVRYVVAATIAGVLLASCSGEQIIGSDTATGNETAVPVRVVAAVIADISSPNDYVARVEARHRVDLAPIGTGLIEKLNVDTGDQLLEGQGVAELSHGALDAQLRQARALLHNAQAVLASVQAEIDPNQKMAQAQVDAAQAKLEELMHPSELDLQAATSLRNQALAELARARTQLRQLKEPTPGQMASARAVVGQAESKLSQAQLATNAAISEQLSSGSIGLSSQTQRLWYLVLRLRLDLQANQATLDSLRQADGLELNNSDIAAAQQIVEQNRRAIADQLSRIKSDSTVPAEIHDGLRAEASARLGLENARTQLDELENPDQYASALAQSRIDSAQAGLDAANARLGLLQSPAASVLASAAAELAAAKHAMLLAQGQYVRHEVEAAQATVDQAQAEVQLVQRQLADLQVLAPFDGTVSRKWLSPGAVATTQTPIITLESQEIVVMLQVQETRLNSFRIGDLARFTSPAVPGSILDLSVERISPRGDFQERTFSVQLRPAGAEPGLKPGMSGEVSMETRHHQAILIPKEALVYRGNLTAVFKLEQNQARLTKVVVGLADGERISILQGLLPGDTVIVSSREPLVDGAVAVKEDPG